MNCMLLLLDENLPKKLIENNFNALITYDKNLQHQQNFKNTRLLFSF